jgi:hypothetical protein
MLAEDARGSWWRCDRADRAGRSAHQPHMIIAMPQIYGSTMPMRGRSAERPQERPRQHRLLAPAHERAGHGRK